MPIVREPIALAQFRRYAEQRAVIHGIVAVLVKGMSAVHTELAIGRWQMPTLAEQLPNVGSEVERAFRAQESGRAERRDRALDRALELFDLTAADDRWRGPRRREILRAREEFCRALLSDGSADDIRGLISWFLHFATLARKGRS